MKKLISITALSFALFFTSCDNNSSSGKAGSDLNANKTETKAVSTDAQNTTADAQQDRCKGNRQVGCTCPQALNPVCGCNGVTYDNGCFAECDGVMRYTFGRCPEGTGSSKSDPR